LNAHRYGAIENIASWPHDTLDVCFYAELTYVCDEDASISLVGAKTKLAPIKSLTIPWFELNAAKLLVRWLHCIKCILDSQPNIIGVHAWTDSTIVLSWLVNCVRFDHQPPQPLIADLPPSRVQHYRPFARVGIDFAGPLQLQETHLCKTRSYKVYVSVFMCFAVKACHLEVVTKISTVAFLASFERFVSRCGLLSEIFSDFGTNFVSAN